LLNCILRGRWQSARGFGGTIAIVPYNSKSWLPAAKRQRESNDMPHFNNFLMENARAQARAHDVITDAERQAQMGNLQNSKHKAKMPLGVKLRIIKCSLVNRLKR